MKEIWKPIPGYEGLYESSNLGRVKCLAKTKRHHRGGVSHLPEYIKDTKEDEFGYHRVELKKDGVGKVIRTHRLVALTFIPNPAHKKQVNHKNGIKSDNRVENLEWVTQQENLTHACENGLRKHISDGDILRMFQLKESGWTIKAISEEIGCDYNYTNLVLFIRTKLSKETISKIYLLKEQGLNQYEIASAVGSHQSYVSVILRTKGLYSTESKVYPEDSEYSTDRRRKLSDKDIEKIHTLRSDGLTQKVISEIIGCSQNHVSQILRAPKQVE